MTRFLSVLLVLLLATAASIAQERYADVSAAGKQVFYEDNFDLNAGWTVGKNGKFGEGKVVLKKGYIKRSVELDFTRSFELEVQIASNNTYGMWYLRLGTYLVDISPRFPELHSFNMVPACKIRQVQEGNNNHSGTPIDFANLRKNEFVKFTIRKSANLYHIFLNEQPVVTYYFPPFKEIYIGTEHVTIEVDDLVISYLDEPENIARIQPAASLPASGGEARSRQPGKYFALLIGVSDYVDNRLDLDKPARDAQELRRVLQERYTFSDSTTTTLINPTRQNIIVALYNLRKQIGPRDNLLIFYAGHGYWDEEAKQGYWWARDALANDPSNWLSNSDVREQIRSIKSAHTLLISDACFSGGIFRTRSANALQSATLDIQMLARLPSRRAITSGTMTTVPDKSVFFEYLVKRLSENTLDFMSSQHLFDSFRQAVINNSLVVPQDGIIAEAGDEGGDFVFIRRVPAN